MAGRLSIMNLLATIVFVLALPSLTDEGSADLKAVLWSLGDPGAETSILSGPVCISDVLHQIYRKHGIPPKLVQAIIQVESQGNPKATSRKGALGLMQLMPGTARRFAVKNSFNPWENIEGGVRYLKYLLDLFDGREEPETLALAAYNAGEGAVLRHGGVPPYQETTQYVRRVAKKWSDARAAAGDAARAAATAQALAYPPIEQFMDSRGILHIQTRSAPLHPPANQSASRFAPDCCRPRKRWRWRRSAVAPWVRRPRR